jgi:hypothetical protein
VQTVRPRVRAEDAQTSADRPGRPAARRGEARETCVVLTGDAPVALPLTGPIELDCLEGAVWIVNSGFPGVVLQAGERHATTLADPLQLQSFASRTRVRVVATAGKGTRPASA